MRLIPSGLGPKLNLSILAFLVMLATVTAIIVFVGFERTQREGTASSRRALEQQARDTIARESQFQAVFGASELGATAGFAQQAARYLAEPSVTARAPAFDEARLARMPNGILYDADPARRTDVAMPAFVTVNDAVLRDIQDSAILEDLFPALLPGFTAETRSENFDAVAIYFDSVNNVTRMYPRFENLSALPPDADVRQQLANLGPEKNPERATRWTPPYEDIGGRGLTLTAFVPVYTGDEFRGTISVDLSLARLINQLEQVRPTAGGYAFYVDSEGNLLRSAAAPIIEAAIADKGNERFARTLEAMRRGETGVDNGELDGQEVFIGYAPLQGVGGTLGIVAPIEEVTAQAGAVASSIEQEQNRTLAVTLAVMAGFFVVALAVAAWLNRRLLLRPIEALVTGTHAVAAGNLDARIPIESEDELGALAGSFNLMTAEIQQRDTALRDEVVERRRTQDELRAVLAALEDVVAVLDRDGRCLRIAPTNPSFHTPPQEAMIGLRLHEMTDSGTAGALLEKIHLALDERRTQYGEYEVRFPEDTYWLAFSVSPMSEDTVVWVARDITERVAAQQNLERRVEERTRELSALLAISRTAASTLELKPIVALILDELKGIADYTGCSFLMLEGDELVIVDSRGPLPNPRETDVIGMRFPVAAAGDFWRVINTGQPVIIDDVRDASQYARTYRRLLGEFLNAPAFNYVRSWIAAPVAVKDRVIGMMSVSSSQPGYFTEENARLIHAVATQVANAVENARLFEQTEQRTRELEALLEISHSVASTLELGPLVAVILEQLRLIIDYNGASVLMPDGDELVIQDFSERDVRTTAPRQRPYRFSMSDMEITWSRMLRKEIMIIDDVRDGSTDAEAFRKATGDLFNTSFKHVRSWLAVPLALRDRVIGMLAISHGVPGFFTPENARLVTAIADQAAIAIDNARLFEETQQGRREMEALFRADAELFRSLSLDAVLQAIVDVTVDVLLVDKSILTLLGDGHERIRGSRNFSPAGLARLQAQVASAGRTPESRDFKVFVLDDTAKERRPDVRAIWEAEGIRSYMAMPIRVDGEAIGAFGVGFTEPHTFSDSEKRLYQALAERSAVAIQNAELYERAQHVASLEERQRLARELHDSVSQALYGIALGARTARTQLDRDPSRAVEPVEYVLSLAEAGLAEMRALIFELRPESLETEGLVAALSKQVASTQARYGIRVDAEFPEEPAAPIAVKEGFYRIGQEALHNIIKHADATHVDLRLSREGEELVLEISDNGAGFDPQQSFPGHLGLHSMRERAEKLGGRLDLDSAPGKGSTITARITLSGNGGT